MQEIHFDILKYHLRLLNWFKISGRHDLPWQKDFNPYHIWISEVMLQQTQVKTVIPYFIKFIQDFKNIDALASANQDTVMLHWAGLGYYTRARNLYKSAQILVNSYGSIIPNDFNSLISLPGIGRSTANAILSIAFNKPAPILDGNVKRVLSRLFLIEEQVNSLSAEKKLWYFAKELIPSVNARSYIQAQMDIGAIVCSLKKPKCQVCPLSNFCLAHKEGKVLEYPTKKSSLTKKIKRVCYYLYFCDNRILLLKNPNHGIWGGLYTLPEQSLGLDASNEILHRNFKHEFTHFKLVYSIKQYKLKRLTIPSAGYIWVDQEEIKDYALPTPLKYQLQKFINK